jgi:hypothetical protein
MYDFEKPCMLQILKLKKKIHIHIFICEKKIVRFLFVTFYNICIYSYYIILPSIRVEEKKKVVK